MIIICLYLILNCHSFHIAKNVYHVQWIIFDAFLTASFSSTHHQSMYMHMHACTCILTHTNEQNVNNGNYIC